MEIASRQTVQKSAFRKVKYFNKTTVYIMCRQEWGYYKTTLAFDKESGENLSAYQRNSGPIY